MVLFSFIYSHFKDSFMKISKHSVVSIHYTLTNDQGQVLDSSEGRSPLAYIQGIGQLIPGLEKALENQETGFKGKVKIAPADAYGERVLELIQRVPRSQFQGTDTIEVGMQFETDSDNGPIVLTVTDVQPDVVVVDGNHPLAGVTLNFDVEITDVRAATQEELDHGHVHGEGGHHH
jgi:FKBP-type peptidyl-prolyl cis-trans isomerase SlyD